MKKILSTAILGSALMATSAFAGVNFGIQGGYATTAGSLNNYVNDLPNNATHKDGNAYYGAYLGYEAPIIPGLFNLGVEANYIYSNNTLRVDGNNGNLQAIPLYVTGKLLLPLDLNVFAKAGYAYSSLNGLNSDGTWKPAVGAGIGMSIYMLDVFAQAQYLWRNSNSGYGLYGVGVGLSF